MSDIGYFTPPSGGGGTGGGGGPAPDPAPVPTSVQGLVTSPINGQLFTGSTSQTTINVQGTYTGTSQNLTVQIVDPTNGNQWTTVGAAPVVSQSFSTIVGPFNSIQFPQGGLLSLRVIDGDQIPLPYELNNDATYGNSALVVGSPGQNPTDWNFLTQAPIGSETETNLYYQTIGAPQSLNAFEAEFFPNGLNSGGAVRTLYYNKGDLAVGRDLACNTTQTGGVACFVSALGDFDGDENEALDDLENPNNVVPTATVAMVYNPPITNPNAVQFIVYAGNGKLQNFAKLDSGGANQSVPQNCLNCHGGQSTFNAGTAQVLGAQFLQLDPLAMDFNQNRLSLQFATQQNAFFQTEQLVEEVQLPSTTKQLLAGEWTSEGGQAEFNPNFVPGAWNTTQRDANLYTQAIAPFCRGCHASIVDDTAGLTFENPADFIKNADKVVQQVCGAGPTGMPVAQATSTRFFNSVTPGCNEGAVCSPNGVTNVSLSARALLLEYLGQATTIPQGCAQGQLQ